MPSIDTRKDRDFSAANKFAAFLEDRNGELLDATVTAAALVARSDGHVQPAERSALIGTLGDSGLLAIYTREEILDAFERRLREFDAPLGTELAVSRLERLAGRLPARFVIAAAGHVARADGRVDPREAAMIDKLKLLMRRPAADSPRRHQA